MTVAETQASKPNTASAGVQSDGPQTQIFDMAIDDKVAALADNIETESSKQAEIRSKRNAICLN